ncbi:MULTISPECIES: acyltransferase [Niastella]|nr:acyltransferase [Niastella soli]
MTLKSIIKNLLPHYIVSRYNQKNNSTTKDSYLKYLEQGNSILRDNFYIRVDVPTAGKRVKIGDDNMLDCNIIFESGTGEVIIGNRVFIGASTIICRSKVEFGNNIFVAWNTCFYDHDSHSLDYRHRQQDITQQLTDFRNGESFIKNKNWEVVNSAPIKICDNAWIGMNALILKGVTVGEGAIVAAGSVVTKSVPAWTVVAGNPAKVVKNLEVGK